MCPVPIVLSPEWVQLPFTDSPPEDYLAPTNILQGPQRRSSSSCWALSPVIICLAGQAFSGNYSKLPVTYRHDLAGFCLILHATCLLLPTPGDSCSHWCLKLWIHQHLHMLVGSQAAAQETASRCTSIQTCCWPVVLVWMPWITTSLGGLWKASWNS